jgi:hypothetical protein
LWFFSVPPGKGLLSASEGATLAFENSWKNMSDMGVTDEMCWTCEFTGDSMELAAFPESESSVLQSGKR